nr:glycosyltransferase [Micromonospora sp. DSM 115978]
MASGPKISVIMPAFNEGAGLGDTLRIMTESPFFGPDLQVIVAANGCTDDTVEIARSFGVRVVEIAEASKPAALNAADTVATGSVLIYQDADTRVDADVLRRLAAAVDRPGVEAAVPHPEMDLRGASWPVRAFYAINGRLPVFRGRLFGRGIIAISRSARARFGRFPDITADDMFLDAIVAADEKVETADVVRVRVPRRADDLIRRVARSRDGNDEFWRFVRSAPAGYSMPADPVPGPSTWSWLRDVLIRAPWLLPAAVCYVAIVLLAERRRRSPDWNVRSGWGRPAPSKA